jgi:uncharacterized protein (UPF0335 family)
MAEDIQYIKKQLEKEMNHLKSLYSKVNRLEKKKEPENYRIKKIEQELKRTNPGLKVDRELLKLVGTEPYSPPSQDKETTRRIIAERYG